ncbi:unnamed protein product [Ilex paraguariensis]|uniref:Chromatin assembly factor 1 subunit FAS1 n=1 Tax=Ilex paraguariensis TaxID=185542 RepID=A0ABC8RDE9_9AQUA
MADPVIVDVEANDRVIAKKSLKRKRVLQVDSLSTEERDARINGLRDELNGLFKYYKEVLEQEVGSEGLSQCGGSSSINSVIAYLLEESTLPLSKLVDAIYGKLKEREGNGGGIGGNVSFTLASVKSYVLLIGQRSFYGMPNADADVLEDDTESCLWCWETRDIKLMPKSMRGMLKIRRICRKKIHERITAISASEKIAAKLRRRLLLSFGEDCFYHYVRLVKTRRQREPLRMEKVKNCTRRMFSVPIDLPGTAYNRAIKGGTMVLEELLMTIRARRNELMDSKETSDCDLLSPMMTALQKSDGLQKGRQELMKASERFGKVLSEADIRLLVDSMAHKNGSNIAEKEAKREEKLLIKQLERNKREVEKEKKRMDRELQKQKLHSEKEVKQLQEEAEKQERRCEKEESQMRKQIRKQLEEAEKDQRRREKEEAELKKQLALQKQASLMERFLQRSKNDLTSQNDQPSKKETKSDSSPNGIEKLPESVTLSMDCVLSLKDEIYTENIWKLHLSSWHQMGHSLRANSKQHWGIRRKPKAEVIKEIKLTTNRGLGCDDQFSIQKFVDDEWGETNVDPICHTNIGNSLPGGQKRNRSKQLLQFDKSYRPAFYGIWPNKTHVVGPRHPFLKDPDLDYEIDSDEEWEEEEPGESLSDCDKDNEEESLEEGFSKVDEEDESEDGFFVPDGYLSENEGVQVDRMESDCLDEEARSSPSRKQELESEEFCILFRRQKCLHNLTEHALRKNQPLIILNLMHEKAPLLLVDDLSGSLKLEQTCLQALSMLAFPGDPYVEISIGDTVQQQGQEASSSGSRGNITAGVAVTPILEMDLPQIVSVIQSCSQGINKVVESLQHKFPAIPKSQLRNKVREISDFTENRWQVKKDILDKLGLSISPEKGSGRTKSIATFFSKRCLPPAGKSLNHNETSPQPSQKPASVVQQPQDYVCNRQ